MAADLSVLRADLTGLFGDKLASVDERLGELTVVVKAADMLDVLTRLRDGAGFDQMIDLCGMDYSTYGDGAWDGKRFAIVYHLLSVARNVRLRVRIFAEDDDFPVLESVADIWSCANWYEREAFDMYGIVFTGHPDLRRLLTDYGFVGSPFRKDFPLSGHVEMRYDPDQRRVVYQPVSIEPREVTPRIVREENYGCN
ncbi:NADH-quinone oxidoreductase subunit C [Ferrigenium kumadai]|uniref:NADH-quinone oxidoreductase subunit C n=1 Tax=Ferrigenium kumadai TaxID=1682490 RepID=A0AAN1VZ74_9PROT|nr:NADH-quinone oxidoreductase subunit C [Ferrigenium kumadai]BBI99049.1 NADH-quinone oxidoreductase subunit C [Ferrigenium kumadai]